MPLLRLLFALLATVSTIWLLNRPVAMQDSALPPLGKFFSPQHGFWQNADPTQPSTDNFHLSHKVLEGPVTILFDSEYIPRIFANNERDAAFAQGYVSAYLRLFQMDLSTRSPIGRLSEVIGERTIEHDLKQRRKGLLEAAERLALLWEADHVVAPILKSFIAGINMRISELRTADLPLEYKLLNFRPQPWTTIHCAAFYLAMSETLARTAHDIPLTNAYQFLGKDAFDLLYPDRNPLDDPVIPYALPQDSTLNNGTQNSSPPPARTWGYHQWIPGSEPGIGSNNWAVSPSKTLNGFPLLCNDPHLALTLPSIWLEMQISTPDQHAYGVAFTAIPGIAIGFNEHIAWGFTNAGHDVQDWYAIQWADQAKTRYKLDGKEIEAVLREEIIHVRGRLEPIRDTVRYTIWGPVPQLDTSSPSADLAMHWLPCGNLDPLMPAVFTQINRAQNLDQWVAPLMRYDAPMQNGLFASKSGDIALRVSGKLPRRNGNQGRLVVDGSLSTHKWAGFVPPSENPMSVNPAQGYIASANQRSTDTTYTHPYTGIFENWRGRIVNEKLRTAEKLSVEDMMAIQNDNTSPLAMEAMNVFNGLIDESKLSSQEKEVLKKLRTWNHRFDALLEEPVVFEMWLKQVDTLCWDELYAISDSLPIEIPEDWRTLDLLSSQPNLIWWDITATPKKETASDVITLAFQNAVKSYSLLISQGKHTWATYQSTTIPHLARIPAFSSLDLALGGHHSALNAMTSTNGPSWRMVVELGPEMKAFGIYPGGQSGNPGSPFYRNFLTTWQKGEYRSLRFHKSAEELQKSAIRVLHLTKS